MEQVIKNRLGRGKKVLSPCLVPEIPSGHLMDEVQIEGVLGPNTPDLDQLWKRCGEDPGEASKSFQGFPGLRFDVFSGCPQGQKKFDNLLVRKTFQTAFQELVTKPLAVTLSFFLPIFFAHPDSKQAAKFSDIPELAKLRLKSTSRSTLRPSPEPFGPELRAEGLSTGSRREYPISSYEAMLDTGCRILDKSKKNFL